MDEQPPTPAANATTAEDNCERQLRELKPVAIHSLPSCSTPLAKKVLPKLDSTLLQSVSVIVQSLQQQNILPVAGSLPADDHKAQPYFFDLTGDMAAKRNMEDIYLSDDGDGDDTKKQKTERPVVGVVAQVPGTSGALSGLLGTNNFGKRDSTGITQEPEGIIKKQKIVGDTVLTSASNQPDSGILVKHSIPEMASVSATASATNPQVPKKVNASNASFASKNKPFKDALKLNLNSATAPKPKKKKKNWKYSWANKPNQFKLQFTPQAPLSGRPQQYFPPAPNSAPNQAHPPDLASFSTPAAPRCPPPDGPSSQVHSYPHYYLCSERNCDKKSSSMELFIRHLIKGHNTWAYKCLHLTCTETFVTRSGLNIHVAKMHHFVREWPCKKCPDMVFHSHIDLYEHHNAHHINGLFTCVACTFTGDSRAKISHHYMETHEVHSQGVKRKAEAPGGPMYNGYQNQSRPQPPFGGRHWEPEPYAHFSPYDPWALEPIEPYIPEAPNKKVKSEQYSFEQPKYTPTGPNSAFDPYYPPRDYDHRDPSHQQESLGADQRGMKRKEYDSRVWETPRDNYPPMYPPPPASASHIPPPFFQDAPHHSLPFNSAYGAPPPGPPSQQLAPPPAPQQPSPFAPYFNSNHTSSANNYNSHGYFPKQY